MVHKYLYLLCAFIIHECLGYLNLFLTSQEVQKTLGLDVELYYIRDGQINNNALAYVMDIPLNVDNLLISWESLNGKALPYNIGITTSNLHSITPKLNITESGIIPTTLQTFTLSVPCTGTVADQVNIDISMNITLQPNNITTIKIQRKKNCKRNETPISSNISVDSKPVTNSVNIFYTAVGSAIILIGFLAICVLRYYLKEKKKKSSRGNSMQPHMTYLTSATRNPTSTCSYGSFRRMPSYSLIDERSKDLQERISELTIQRCRVGLNSVILEGTFGRVYLGSYTDENGRQEEVLVKTVTDHASQIQISLLLQEGMFMYSLNHKNILTILGVSIEDQTAPFLLYPYHSYKNLKVFLQKCKLNSEGVAHTLTTQEVVDMALQVIQGMQYLHKKHLWHKDLAARNCVVDDKLRIKVTDNALSRDLFPSDYHCLGDNENRPIKWMAIESLLQKEFSSSSDVWSFGVLLWELTTLAQQPYVEIDPFEVAAYLKDGYRLAQPVNCPDELFAVMAYCWAMSPSERPTFTQLQVCLQEFYAQLIRYV
nr:tyrosine-protein kinase Dnt-like isoform X1 [Onthophagus taurus]